jgi:hypothetical protein
MITDALRLAGFESDLATKIAADFRFSGDEFLEDLELEVARHLFSGWMPEATEIGNNLADPSTYDPRLEPCIAFYSDPNSGGVQSASYGGKLTLITEVVVRLPKENNAVAALLAQLIEWIEANLVDALVGEFRVKSVTALKAPGNFVRLQDASMFASSRVRFLAVKAS